MNKCIMCDKEIRLDTGYVSDGEIFVCAECAAKNSLMRIVTRIENNDAKSYLAFHWSEPVVVEASVSDSVSASDVESVSVSDVSSVSASDVESVSNIERDIDSLSPEDFLSKYADNPEAIGWYMEKRPEAVAAYEADHV